MGIRISAFAVDVAAFEPWLRRSVADVFFYLAQNVVGKTTFPSAYDAELRRRYVITEQRQIRRVGPNTAPLNLAMKDALAIPMLAQPVCDYLHRGNSNDLLFLLRSMAACPGLDAVQVLTDGYRPSWIGSLLHTARNIAYLPPPVMSELEGFFARMLRRWSCGHAMKHHEEPPHPDKFPCLPPDDVDSQMAVLSDVECIRLFEILDELLSRNPRFVAPPLLHAAGDTDWDVWVREMIAALRNMATLPLRDPRMITFID
jgi:hypothetical protein